MSRHVQIPPGITEGQTLIYDAATDTLVAAELLISDTGEPIANDALDGWLYGG